jgi:hypothetical protein
MSEVVYRRMAITARDAGYGMDENSPLSRMELVRIIADMATKLFSPQCSQVTGISILRHLVTVSSSTDAAIEIRKHLGQQ